MIFPHHYKNTVALKNNRHNGIPVSLKILSIIFFVVITIDSNYNVSLAYQHFQQFCLFFTPFFNDCCRQKPTNSKCKILSQKNAKQF